MKNILSILICVVLSAQFSFAQNNYSGMFYRSTEEIVQYHHIMKSCVIADSTAIDTVVLQVDYRYEFVRITPSFTILRLEKGASWVKQRDMRMYLSAIIYASENQGGRGIDLDAYKQARKTSGVSSSLFLEMLYAPQEGMLTVTCGDFFNNDQPSMYQEPLPKIDWTQTEQTDSVCGYACNTAQATFRGREWKVWYAPEIPLNLGPWKLSGLPGLILRAETKGFRFECVVIRQPKNQPIYRNSYKRVKDFKTREKYMSYERASFEHPFEIGQQGAEMEFVMKNPQGGIIMLDDTWTVPYDPLEVVR